MKYLPTLCAHTNGLWSLTKVIVVLSAIFLITSLVLFNQYLIHCIYQPEICLLQISLIKLSTSFSTLGLCLKSDATTYLKSGLLGWDQIFFATILRIMLRFLGHCMILFFIFLMYVMNFVEWWIIWHTNSHPDCIIHRAVLDHSVGKDLPLVAVESFECLPGRGVVATLSGVKVDYIVYSNQLGYLENWT